MKMMDDNSQTALNFLQKLYFSATRNRNTLREAICNTVKNQLKPFSLETQEKILKATTETPLSIKYPPPFSFRKLFLRTIINIVEENNEEVAENLLLLYTNLLSGPISDDQSSYCIYFIDDKTVIVLQESQNIIENGTTGLRTWEAAKHMAEWCMENMSIFKGRNILELGSGTGLLGFTILKVCYPLTYVFTDKSEDVLHVLEVNKHINSQCLLQEPHEKNKLREVSFQNWNTGVEIQHLNWSDVIEGKMPPFSPEIIIGADIVFDPSIIQKLVQTLKHFLCHSAYCAYVASTIRNEDTDLKFREELNSASLECECLKKEATEPVFLYDQTACFRIYKITKRK